VRGVGQRARDVHGEWRHVGQIGRRHFNAPRRIGRLVEHQLLQRAFSARDHILSREHVAAPPLDFGGRLREVGDRDGAGLDTHLRVGFLLFGQREAAVPHVQISTGRDEGPIRRLHLRHRLPHLAFESGA
jgi:hypothetical protein